MRSLAPGVERCALMGEQSSESAGAAVSTDDLALAVAAVRTLFDAAACSVALADEDGGTLEFVAADGAGAAGIVGVSIPVVARDRRVGGDVRPADRRADVADRRPLRPRRGGVDRLRAHQILAAPLLSTAGEVLGVIEVLDPQVEESTDWTSRCSGRWPPARDARRTPCREPADGLADLGRQVLEAVDRHRAGER